MLKYALLGLFAIALIGCSSDNSTTTTPSTATSTSAPGSSTQTTEPDQSTTSAVAETPPPSTTAPSKGPGAPPNAGEDVGVIETNLGRIVVKFFPSKAPKTVKNFKDLAKKGFYDGTKFHRVIPTFMIQGGDPNSKDDNRSDDGTGGPGYTIPDEFSDIHHAPGILSMAHTSEPNSGGSQFFIMVGDHPDLDHLYAAFGQVVEGMDVVDKIVNLPRDEGNNPLPANPAVIKSVKIKKWPLK